MSQTEAILKYVKQHGSITSKEAYDELGITQLGARLDDLEKQGYIIDRSEWKTVTDRRGNLVDVKDYKIDRPGQKDAFGKPKDKHQNAQLL